MRSLSTIPRVVILVDTSTSRGRRIVHGVHQFSRQHGPWNLMVEALGQDEPLRLPRNWKGDGVIARIHTHALARDLQAAATPVVNVSGIQIREALGIPRVMTDIDAAVQIAIDHFLDRGFRHFACFSCLGLSYVSTQQNRYVRSLQTLGLQCAVYKGRSKKGTEIDWIVAIDRLAGWLKSLPKPVGVLTWNASCGRQVLYGCHQSGLKIPEEVALLSGVDDDLLCEASSIPLSGLSPAAENIGYEAAAMLDARMRNHALPVDSKTVKPLGVVTRQSTDTLAIEDPDLATAIRFIRKNGGTAIQVPDILRHVPISRRSLERKFLHRLGRSPAEEIRRVHLEHARTLLLESEMSIPEVARHSGFGSPEYMAYVFKTELGVSPVQYRRTVRPRRRASKVSLG